MPMRLDIVTIERQVFSGDVDMVVAPGINGELGILPSHAPLITVLAPGVLRVTQDDEQEVFAIGGGYLEVLNNRVTVLADTAEHSSEIDIARAEEARERAEQLLREGADTVDRSRIEGALRRSRVRLKVARRRRAGTPRPGRPDAGPRPGRPESE